MIACSKEKKQSFKTSPNELRFIYTFCIVFPKSHQPEKATYKV